MFAEEYGKEGFKGMLGPHNERSLVLTLDCFLDSGVALNVHESGRDPEGCQEGGFQGLSGRV